ncbi:HPr family phosphocarrier protein [Actinoalloteichus sp. AHMU CJ021]|uniref:Phosphocarrier protein HPr n=1 Tax=Actinoalloteichus caeruleus DSM 43889 TaxID=1120930 RepID=A0ABT1JBE8_ACTCY|nr:HPr family phosphocarrier protein [Actinoalloteichus caeruleus]AUS80478.1 HPr family phosphocarrier protein [Actinoalloteichus sp. AHMU CJ021]MCP2329822.1 phosphocarrier protein [Actinoalloteichus caeruleus DSM 43889]
MYARRVVVAASVGLHARPAALVARRAAEQGAAVSIAKVVDGTPGDAVSAASMLGLMTLAAGHGDEVELSADGDGAREAVDALAAVIELDPDAEEAAVQQPS